MIQRLILEQELATMLRKRQTERPQRQQFVRAEPAWVHYEREQMLAAVNVARGRRGKTPLELERIIAAEVASHGPTYVERFSRACAELVLE